MRSKQVVTIGRQTFPVTYSEKGPTITGVFTPEQKRFITRVYGVHIVDSSVPPKHSHKR